MKVINFLKKFLDRFKKLEETSVQIENKWDIFTVEGVQLDHIGEFLLPRNFNETDENYKKRLLSQIAINTSMGDIEDLIRIFKIISNATRVRIINHGNGIFAVELNATEVYLLDFLIYQRVVVEYHIFTFMMIIHLPLMMIY